MTEGNKELLDVLREINEKLGDIRFDLKDIKTHMPKVPYYGDLLQDIKKSVDELKR
ncbi:MAG: hypothetical protein ACRKGH_03190 [Dehalogenimonas sp.]